MTLKELSEKTGLSPRTIRFYIAQGLLSGPVGLGRSAFYDESHLEALRRVEELKGSGKAISEIKVEINPSDVRVSEPEQLWSYSVSEDVTVLVRSDVSPWRARRIRRALGELSRVLSEDVEED